MFWLSSLWFFSLYRRARMCFVCTYVFCVFMSVCFWSVYACVLDWTIGLEGRVFSKGPVDRGSSPSRVIGITQKTVFDAYLFNTQHYKVWIKGKVEQSRERSCTLAYPPVF